MDKSDSINVLNKKYGNKGGRTTIRPPAKINKTLKKSLKILCSGVDTLYLSIDVFWKDLSFFHRLQDKKANAVAKDKDLCFPIHHEKLLIEYLFNIRPYGAQGYEWLLYNRDYSLRIGNWIKPKNRPSIRIQFHSRTLWLNGLKKSIVFILRLIKELGGKIHTIKISRLDLCVDTLFPEEIWNKKLIDKNVTRSRHAGMYFNNKNLTGVTFGKGHIHARFYDKPLEIEQKSKKYWFFDQVWKIDEVPEGYKLIRIEFQLQREIIKDLGLNKLGHLYRLLNNAWAYCTGDWLKFQNNPGKQSHQRKTYPWWKTIQTGFTITNSIKEPLVRCKRINPDKKTLFSQSFGTMSSLFALETETNPDRQYKELTIHDSINSFLDNISEFGKTNNSLKEDVFNKRAKYQKLEQKYAEATAKRKKLGFI